MWLSLLLGVYVEATSNGVAMTCDVDAKLGTPDRVKPVGGNTTIMWWVTSPAFAHEQYTLRTADTPTPATDPTTYVPGQYTTIHIRTTYQDQQFTGLVLYATNRDGRKVGTWQVPVNTPYHTRDEDQCVVHSNADPKNYLSTFKFLGPPVGTGDITIKALVKFGLAFPSATSMFWWPNAAHLVLREQAQTVRAWYEGEPGENCIDVCRKRNLGCDLKTMREQGNSSAMLAKVAPFSNCSGILLPGCSAHSPSVGAAGCFYHSDTCEQPPVQPAWERVDICEGVPDYVAGTNYPEFSCVKYAGEKWCAQYYTSEAPPVNDFSEGKRGYGPWGMSSKLGGRKGSCKPAGGWPAGQGTVTLPTRMIRSASATTCEASKASSLDGRRICACSTDGQRTANSASRMGLPLAVIVFLVAIASF